VGSDPARTGAQSFLSRAALATRAARTSLATMGASSGNGWPDHGFEGLSS